MNKLTTLTFLIFLVLSCSNEHKTSTGSSSNDTVISVVSDTIITDINVAKKAKFELVMPGPELDSCEGYNIFHCYFKLYYGVDSAVMIPRGEKPITVDLNELDSIMMYNVGTTDFMLFNKNGMWLTVEYFSEELGIVGAKLSDVKRLLAVLNKDALENRPPESEIEGWGFSKDSMVLSFIYEGGVGGDYFIKQKGDTIIIEGRGGC